MLSTKKNALFAPVQHCSRSVANVYIRRNRISYSIDAPITPHSCQHTAIMIAFSKPHSHRIASRLIRHRFASCDCAQSLSLSWTDIVWCQLRQFPFGLPAGSSMWAVWVTNHNMWNWCCGPERWCARIRQSGLPLSVLSLWCVSKVNGLIRAVSALSHQLSRLLSHAQPLDVGQLDSWSGFYSIFLGVVHFIVNWF